jgi:methanogenic corrinoid protein MtbC1
VLIFATLLRRLGIRTRYVGADLPVESWVSAVRALQPDAVVLAAPMDVDAAAVHDTLAGLAEVAPDVPVFVGGACQDAVAEAERLGHDVQAAARELTDRLQGLPRTAA